jgi:hypothetical protein
MENLYRVSKKQWKKWSPLARAVFNDVYSLMYDNPTLFKHPKDVEVKHLYWKTTAWNAAWIAAEAVKDNQ